MPGQAAARVVSPDVVPYLPPGHSEQAAAPAALYCPAGHKATVALTVPAGHAYPAEQVQGQAVAWVVSPATAPYLPPGHSVHAAAATPLKDPAAHKTLVALADPGGQAYPAEHGEQAPNAAGLKKPPAHTAMVVLDDPGGQEYPAGHAYGHAVEAFTAATASPKDPAAHSVHADAPALLLKDPGTQAIGLVGPPGQA